MYNLNKIIGDDEVYDADFLNNNKILIFWALLVVAHLQDVLINLECDTLRLVQKFNKKILLNMKMKIKIKKINYIWSIYYYYNYKLDSI